MATLKEFNGKKPYISNICIIMRTLHDHEAALCNAPFNMPSHLVDPLEVALRKKEGLVYNDLHYASALLNPHLIHGMELCNDQYAMVDL
jgi:hypothetical protein